MVFYLNSKIITMKIRRIDSLDLLSHASHLTKQKTHRRTVSGINERVKGGQPGTNLFSGVPVHLKVPTDKRASKNEQKAQVTCNKAQALCNKDQVLCNKAQVLCNKDQVLCNKDQVRDKQGSLAQKQRICNLYQKLQSIHCKLSQLYKLNQQKLSQILLRHIKQQYYIYQKQLSHLVKSLHLNKPLPKLMLLHPCLSKLYHEITRLCEFMQMYHGRKCLQAVQIVEGSILLRQNAIRQYTTRDRYKTITKAFYPKLITNQIDIVSQFKSIYHQTGKVLNQAQSEMFQKLRSSQAKISQVFSTVRKQKEIDIFQGRKFTYVIR